MTNSITITKSVDTPPSRRLSEADETHTDEPSVPCVGPGLTKINTGLLTLAGYLQLCDKN